jgi:hypothetical protein
MGKMAGGISSLKGSFSTIIAIYIGADDWNVKVVE